MVVGKKAEWSRKIMALPLLPLLLLSVVVWRGDKREGFSPQSTFPVVRDENKIEGSLEDRMNYLADHLKSSCGLADDVVNGPTKGWHYYPFTALAIELFNKSDC